METLSLADAKIKRVHIKSAVTRLKTFIDNFDINCGSQHGLTEQRLSELWNQFEAAQFRIEILENADPSITDKRVLHEQHAQQRDNFEVLFQLMACYTALIERMEKNASPPTSNINAVRSTSGEIEGNAC